MAESRLCPRDVLTPDALEMLDRIAASGSFAAAARAGGSWGPALALFVYAVAFSYAFMHVPVSTGTLLLFAAVQATMVAAALWAGERLSLAQWTGFGLAIAGLVAMLLPSAGA